MALIRWTFVGKVMSLLLNMLSTLVITFLPRSKHLLISWLECEVKWALESITTNEASGGDGIPVELFQILKDDAVQVLHSICQQIWKTQQWPQDWKRSVFTTVPKKGNAKECSDYRTIALISHTSQVMLKILQARLQQHVNRELPDVQAGFRKGRGTRDQIAIVLPLNYSSLTRLGGPSSSRKARSQALVSPRFSQETWGLGPALLLPS